jgi:hypothetical protein
MVIRSTEPIEVSTDAFTDGENWMDYFPSVAYPLPRQLSSCRCSLRRADGLLYCVTDCLSRKGLFEEIRNPKLLRSLRDGTSVITRDQNDWRFTPLRPNPLCNIESGTHWELAAHYIRIKRFLFDGSESIGDRLACLDPILRIGKHPSDDPTECDVVVHH